MAKPGVAAEEKTTPLERERLRSTRKGIGLGESKITENLKHVSNNEREEARRWLPVYDEYADQRPKTRGDCVDAPRPCPWISCRHHLYLEVKTTGVTKDVAIIMNFPDVAPEDVPPDRSCALDVADQGGATLEDVGRLTNLTRERMRQVQARAILKLERHCGVLGEFVDDLDRQKAKQTTRGENSMLGDLGRRVQKLEIASFEAADDEGVDLSTESDAVSFMSTGSRNEERVQARVWRIYTRESIEKGYVKRPKSERQKKLEAGGAPVLVDPLLET